MLEFLLSVPQTVFTSLIIIFTAISTIIPLLGVKLRDGRGHRKWYRGFTNAGYFVFVCVIIAATITLIKDGVSNELNEIKEVHIETQRKQIARETDSLNAIKQNESNALIIQTFTASLAKYGLKYDSTSKDIKKLIIDSTRKQEIHYGNDGEVVVSNITKLHSRNDSLSLEISFKANHQTCYDVFVDIIPLLEANTGEVYGYPRFKLIRGVSLDFDVLGAKALSMSIKEVRNVNNIILATNFRWKNEKGKPFKKTRYFIFQRDIDTFGTLEESAKTKFEQTVKERYPDF